MNSNLFLIIAALKCCARRSLNTSVVAWSRVKIECTDFLSTIPFSDWLNESVLAHEIVCDWILNVHLPLEQFH